MITKNTNTAVINFKDSMNLNDVVAGSINNNFLQGNSEFILELTAQKGAEVQVNLDDSMTRAVVYSDKYETIVGEVAIDNITNGVITIDGDEIITHKEGVNLLFIQEENSDGDFETTYSLVYNVDYNPLYKATIKPPTSVEEYVKSINGINPDNLGNLELNASDILDKNGNTIQSGLDDLFSEVERLDKAKAEKTDIPDISGIATNKGLIDANTSKIDANTGNISKNRTDIDANKSAIDNLGTSKLNTDLGNVNDNGFMEKLRDAKVQFEKASGPGTNIPAASNTVEYQEIHENDNHDLTITKRYTKVNLQIDTDGQAFEVNLPETPAGTIILLGGIEHPDVQSRGQVVVKMIQPSSWQIQGGTELIMDNVKQTYYFLISTGSSYLATPMFDEFEEADGDIIFNDLVGGTLKSNMITLGRGLVIKQDKHTSLYEDSEDIAPEVSVDNVQTYANLDENNVIDLAPQIYNAIIGNDGLYATLDAQEEIKAADASKDSKGKLWFDNVKVNTKGFIELKRNEKTYGLQDALNDDPNVTGGQPALIVTQISMLGIAPENGHVYLSIVDSMSGQPILDTYGNPLKVGKDYKAGEKLGKLNISDLLMDKGLNEVNIIVEHSFKTDSIVLDDLGSFIMIQYLTHENQSGEALRTLEAETGLKFNYIKRYVGKDFFNLQYALDINIPETDLNPGDGMLGNDGIQFYPATKMKTSIKDGVIKLSDNNDICYFNIGKVFSVEDTRLLSGSEIDVDVVAKDTDDSFRVYLVGTNEDNPGSKIFTGQSNMQPQLESGWSIISDNGFIEENVQGTFKGHSFNFNIPDTYKRVGVIIAPVSAQMPLNLELSKFEISSVKDSYVWNFIAPSYDEYNFIAKDSDAKFYINTPKGAVSLRYTINANPTKFPVGFGTDLDLVNVMNWKDSGYKGEGVLEAKQDMLIKKLSITFNKTLYFGEKKPKGNNERLTSFWSIGDNSGTPLALTTETSEFVDAYPPNEKVITHTVYPNVELKKGEDLWLWLEALEDDGLYVLAPTGKHLIDVIVEYEEITKRP